MECLGSLFLQQQDNDKCLLNCESNFNVSYKHVVDWSFKEMFNFMTKWFLIPSYAKLSKVESITKTNTEVKSGWNAF